MANYRITPLGVQCKKCDNTYGNIRDFRSHFRARHASSQPPVLSGTPNFLNSLFSRQLQPSRPARQSGSAGPSSLPTQRPSSPKVGIHETTSSHLNRIASSNGQSAPKIYQLSYSYPDLNRIHDRNYTQSFDHKMLGQAYAATIGASNSSSPSNPRHIFHGVHASNPTTWNSLSPHVSSKGFWNVAPNTSNLKSGTNMGQMQGVLAYAGSPSSNSRFVTVWKTDQNTFHSSNVSVSVQSGSPKDKSLSYNGVIIPYQEFKEINNMADGSQKTTLSTHFSKSDYTRITLAYCLNSASSNRDFARGIMDAVSPHTRGKSLEDRINRTDLSRSNTRMANLDSRVIDSLRQLSKPALVSFDRKIQSTKGGSSSPPRVSFVSGDNSHGITYIAKPPEGSSTVQGLTLAAIYQLPTHR